MPRSRATNTTLLALGSLGAALVVLATLQYRWIGRLADADARRMRASVEFAAGHFSDEFDHELTRTFIAFAQPNPGGSAEDLARRYDQWAAAARDPRLIRSVYFVPVGSTQLQRLDIAGRRYVAVEWPASLNHVRAQLQAAQMQRPHMIQPIQPALPALVIPCGDERMFLRHLPMQGEMLRHLGFDNNAPRERSAGGEPGMVCPAFTIVELDGGYIVRVLLPELTKRYFQNEFGGDYQVALMNGETGQVMYRSDPEWPRGNDVRGDVAAPIFGLRLVRSPEGEPARMPLQWRLVARNRSGSLAEAVAAIRRRNLAVALAIVAVLGGSAATLMVMLRRAQRLQQQQMEFVAGITHELNTPLTALTSAGQNLADGIISDREQVSRYGSIVVKEARRLSDMVAQVLDYAGIQSGRTSARVEDVDVRSVIAEAIEQCRWIAEDASVRIESGIPHESLPVRGDSNALTRAVQNLIANAVRHGGEGGWVRVSAGRDGDGVSIVVEDGGRGISAGELPHLFEPFFRGAASSRVRGSGLGLTIVQQIVNAHHGRVTVAKDRSAGAAFTIHLPASPQPVQAGEIAGQHA